MPSGKRKVNRNQGISPYQSKKPAHLNLAPGGVVWEDIRGRVHSTKIGAQFASFRTLFAGRLKTGFPVVVNRWPNRATAFWPFIFVRKDACITRTLNHEMIHIRQQLELFVVFGYVWYVLELLWKWVYFRDLDAAYWNHSMEREARKNEHNMYYLARRKRFAFFKYLKP